VADTVEVAAGATLVNTVSAEQREGVGALQVRELPLARRNYTGLLPVGTGITVASSGAQPGHGDRDGGVRLNGLGRSGTTFTLDGTDANANNEGRSGNMFTNLNYIDIISIEAIQEVQVVKGIIAAEYGQALSGNVNLITKSGTNEFHGSLFENFQSQRLNARNQFLTYKPPVTFNQFGGSFGGPVVKNKIFFFGAYEGYREAFFRLVSENTPTQNLRDQMIQRSSPVPPCPWHIVITCHGDGRSLRDTAASVFRTDADYELTVVDDASNGAITGVVEELRKIFPALRYIRNQSPLGAREARNRAIRAVDSTSVVLLDAGDMLDADRLYDAHCRGENSRTL